MIQIHSLFQNIRINFQFHFSETCVIHDSYFCKTRKHFSTRPFPTQRLIEANEPNYVGTSGDALNKTCPEDCRPYNHLDWEFC